MGLDVSHDAWHGPYSSFHRWRVAIAAAVGIDLEIMYDRAHEHGEAPKWPSPTKEPLVYLLNHSDCDGHITPKRCALIAKRLREIAPVLNGDYPSGYWSDRAKAIRFAKGCEDAAAAGQLLEFD